MKLLAVISSFALLLAAFADAGAQEQPARTLEVSQNAPGSPGSRVALVIGNSEYKIGRLANPVNDARDMAKALSGLGFAVTLKENATQREMKQAIREFAERIREGGTGLVYFAGHGVQSKGRNYLIPVDADVQQEFELEDQAVDANLILGAMDEAQNPVNILILDACRNNPFARSFRSAQGGLAQMDAAKGTLIAYATAPGSVAADGEGRNGIYTKNLLANLRNSDSEISRVFSRTRAAVVRETNGRQVPWESTSLIGDFYFDPARATASQASSEGSQPAVSGLAVEIAFWESVQQSKNKADFDAYLSRYPQGQYAELARNRLKDLAAQSQPAAGNRAAAGTAKVFFYRPSGFVGWGSTSVVTVAGRELGQLSNGSYFVADVPSGTQVVSVEHGEWSGSRVFDFETSGVYYVKFEYSLGRVSLRPVKEDEAKDAMRSLPDSASASNKH